MPLFCGDRLYGCSAVAEMGDRLATIDVGRKVGGCCALFQGMANAFNADKCKVMHMGFNNKQAKYDMNDGQLECVSEEKDLGSWESLLLGILSGRNNVVRL